jgi:hypothetical protein
MRERNWAASALPCCVGLAQARVHARAWFEDTSAQTRRQTTRDRI